MSHLKIVKFNLEQLYHLDFFSWNQCWVLFVEHKIKPSGRVQEIECQFGLKHYLKMPGLLISPVVWGLFLLIKMNGIKSDNYMVHFGIMMKIENRIHKFWLRKEWMVGWICFFSFSYFRQWLKSKLAFFEINFETPILTKLETGQDLWKFALIFDNLHLESCPQLYHFLQLGTLFSSCLSHPLR